MQIKLCDFGLCNVLQNGEDQTLMECKVGTSGYQAPEIANGAIVTPAIDMWAFGVILHEWAVCYKPVHLSESGEFSINQSHWRDVDAKLLDLVKLCLRSAP